MFAFSWTNIWVEVPAYISCRSPLREILHPPIPTLHENPTKRDFAEWAEDFKE
jgi:hypothetical protein